MFASTAYSAIAFVALAIIWNSHTVESSIKCFVCNSHTDPKCAQEKVPDSFKKDCALLNNGVHVNDQKNYTLCRKTIQTIEPEVNGLPSDHNRIIRTCGWDNTEYNDRCYHRSGFGGKQDVCACSSDYCNSAQKTYIAFATVMAASFIILIL